MSNLDPNLVRKIKSAFTVFDQTSNGTCDVREIGTVIRSLGVNPSEEQLREKIFSSNAAIRNDEEEIYRAFLALDAEKKGFLLPDDLKRFMMTEGEPFSQEEMDEMLAACTDTSDNRVYYEDFVSLLAANE
ncbi:EF-hand [Rhizoclosmatium globosum]|uniref:EF-hand n=1 Tax=Rhizoclosmatium globosum TaxID=329046 RepID=A0A1Y2CIY6_9FUNG|nr:EF-hand [Rhizoclosmatium globosum]|eukprot:ORY46926.1 EF-hand [Rhizoclosmatium globosum]